MLAWLPALRALTMYLPFTISAGVPVSFAARAVALAWRKHYPRKQAIEAIIDSIQACQLPGINPSGKAARS